MEYSVTVQPSGRTFETHSTETLLESGLRAGLNLDFGCSNGGCGECKIRVLQGETEYCRSSDYILTPQEKQAKQLLACCTRAISDLIVEAHEAGGVDEMPIQSITAKVSRIEYCGDVAIVHVRTSRSKPLRFLAGQYINLAFSNGSDQCFGVASCPCDSTHLRVHVDRHQATDAVAHVFSALRKNDQVDVRGPVGKFTLDESSTRPLVFITRGVGFAPVESLIEHAISLELPQAMYLLRLGEGGESPYLSNYCRSWHDALDDFHYQELECLQAESILQAIPNPECADYYLGVCDSQQELFTSLTKAGIAAEAIRVDDHGVYRSHCRASHAAKKS